MHRSKLFGPFSLGQSTAEQRLACGLGVAKSKTCTFRSRTCIYCSPLWCSVSTGKTGCSRSVLTTPFACTAAASPLGLFSRESAGLRRSFPGCPAEPDQAEEPSAEKPYSSRLGNDAASVGDVVVIQRHCAIQRQRPAIGDIRVGVQRDANLPRMLPKKSVVVPRVAELPNAYRRPRHGAASPPSPASSAPPPARPWPAPGAPATTPWDRAARSG